MAALAASRRSILRYILHGVLVGGIGAVSVEAANILVGPNFHEVIPGLVYRTAQPSADRLERLIKTHGIRTVVNFRGVCEDSPWYQEQCRVTSRHGVSEEDLNGSSAGRLPSVFTIRELVRILENSEPPILFHCHRGIDRTGMASAIALLLKTPTPVAEARKQLSLCHGHLAFGKTGNIDRFFDLYEEWLAATGQTHAPAVFRHWMMDEYCPGPYRAVITPLDPPQVAARQVIGFRVRCRNISAKPWQFKPGNNAGIHAWYYVDNAEGKNITGGQSGLFDAIVPPGESIDLTLALPVLAPGKYTLRVDMADEQHGFFFQEGSTPLFLSLEAQ